MSPKVLRVIGWVLSGLIAAFLIVASGVPKFIEWEGKDKMLEGLGITSDTLMKIGVVEVVLALLLVVPRAGFLAAILLTGYLGGATFVHVRAGEPFFFPIAFGIAAWVAVALRNPAIFRLLIGKQPTTSSTL